MATDGTPRAAICTLQDELDVSRFAIRYTSPHPIVQLEFDDRFLPPILQRMAAAYIEALDTNSPFYAFLCRYKLVDALTSHIQGAFRRLSQQHGIQLRDLNDTFQAEEVAGFLPEVSGLGYREVTTSYNELRVRVAHLLTSVGFQALNAASQEQAERLSQALHIAARKLLNRAIDNYQDLRQANVDEAAIQSELERNG